MFTREAAAVKPPRCFQNVFEIGEITICATEYELKFIFHCAAQIHNNGIVAAQQTTNIDLTRQPAELRSCCADKKSSGIDTPMLETGNSLPVTGTQTNRSADDFAPTRLLAASGIVTAVWAAAASRWLLTDSVVPWDSKNQFYTFYRFLSSAIHSGESPF